MRVGAALLGGVFSTYKRAISPMLHGLGWSRCIFLPTCSEYAYVALERHGLVRGGWLALRRVGRCQPWSAGGFDPVPERRMR